LNTLKGKIITVIVVVVVAAAAYGIGAGHLFVPTAAEAVPAQSQYGTIPAQYDQNTVMLVYKAVSPAVVEVDMTEGGSSFFNQTSGLGSGILLDSAGDILTNNHVVDGATSVSVKLSDGTSVPANVVGKDAIDDLAIINIGSSAVDGLPTLSLGDSSQVQPGQMAIAIGNPYGLDNSVTVGVISGLDRSIGNMTGMIQTDAAINPGNSGGPLLVVDDSGNGVVIGINTAIETSPTGAVGIGFAVPSNVVKNVVGSLENGTTVARPWIGISGTAVTDTLAQQLGLPDTVTSGVYVVSVTPNSPAQTAGLKGGNLSPNGGPAPGGDVITAIDGNKVATVPDISNYINTNKKVGDTVELTVQRGSDQTQVPVTLGTWPDNLAQNAPQANPQQPFPFQIPNMPFGNGGRHYRQGAPSN
jgi:S1-C subfamily serine protease